MTASQRKNKGRRTEELLRAYFIRSGVYAVRGVPLRVNGEDLTDVDIWLYERPTGASRRTWILDAKSKTRPKAVERVFWTKGLWNMLDVDGAYVATTDTRPVLRKVARQLGISVLDGSDIKRISKSEKILFGNRLLEEELEDRIRAVDQARHDKVLQQEYRDLKAGLIEGFAGGTVNRALDHFERFSKRLAHSHPQGAVAEAMLRMSYMAASFAAIAMDCCLAKVSFKSAEERKATIVNVVRYGSEYREEGLESVRIAAALVERVAENGRALAQRIEAQVKQELEDIPAEELADYVLKHLKADGLFGMARTLEERAFERDLVGYDNVKRDEKGFLGVLLDFSGTDRMTFAAGWEARSHGRDLRCSPATQKGDTPDLLADMDASGQDHHGDSIEVPHGE